MRNTIVEFRWDWSMIWNRRERRKSVTRCYSNWVTRRRDEEYSLALDAWGWTKRDRTVGWSATVERRRKTRNWSSIAFLEDRSVSYGEKEIEHFENRIQVALLEYDRRIVVLVIKTSIAKDQLTIKSFAFKCSSAVEWMMEYGSDTVRVSVDRYSHRFFRFKVVLMSIDRDQAMFTSNARESSMRIPVTETLADLSNGWRELRSTRQSVHPCQKARSSADF